MSQVFTPVFVIIFGGLVAIVVAILALTQLAGVGGLGSQSANLVSSGQSLGEILPIIAMILGIGVFGTILGRR